jgi:nucleoside 2-deoxyribosyltransferase
LAVGKVYLAGPWDDRAKMPSICKLFEGAGFEVTHKWWNFEVKGVDGKTPDPDHGIYCALADYNGVSNADVLVVLNSIYSEGKAVEMGLAMAWNKPICIIGRNVTNVFLNLSMYKCDFPHEALEWALLNVKGVENVSKA